MDVRAELSFLRVSPKKVRLVTNLVRGLSAQDAEVQLAVLDKAAAGPLTKLLKSALANAKQNHQLEPEQLYVKHFLTNEGPKLKRYRPRAHGRAAIIRKRSSHVTLVLGSRGAEALKSNAEAKPAAKQEAPK